MTKSNRMFSFITESKFNPLGGECHHNCYGNRCWAKQLIKRYGMKKYQGTPRLFEHELKRVFSKEDFVFVCDMCDLFGNWVPSELIRRVVLFANCSPAQFLFLTKNPKRYLEFPFASNCVLGATIETDLEDDADYAPPRNERLDFMANTRISNLYARKMVSIEPVMKFTKDFADRIIAIKPEFVAVGYDNYNCGLSEPSMQEVNELIVRLADVGIKVYRKTMR